MSEHSKPSKAALDKIFGAPLPDTTADEREPSSADDATSHERWLRDNIPRTTTDLCLRASLHLRLSCNGPHTVYEQLTAGSEISDGSSHQSPPSR